MISQITPDGLRPASRARSTAASVWPARSSTPPDLALSGKMWPGWTMSRGVAFGSIATWIVRARSCAEIPVVTPCRASIETVNGVSNGDSFLAAMRSSPRSSQRSGVSDRQTRPRAWVTMKFTASGVANCAAIVRSPSFSRSSSSQTTTILPWRMSSSASSIVANGLWVLGSCHQLFKPAPRAAAGWRVAASSRTASTVLDAPCSVSSPASLRGVAGVVSPGAARGPRSSSCRESLRVGTVGGDLSCACRRVAELGPRVRVAAPAHARLLPGRPRP